MKIKQEIKLKVSEHFCFGCPCLHSVHYPGKVCALNYDIIYNENAARDEIAFQRPEKCIKENGE